MRNLDLTHTLANPPNVARIPYNLVYITHYALHLAYEPSYTPADTLKTLRKRIYDVLMHMDEAKHSTPEIRIVRKYPGIP